jgi:NadR type nicotinamide-nucleotide adenylyltransferase
MMRIAVTGSECTGKTTLATSLARHFRVPLVPEAAREFVRLHQRPPVAGDVGTIARMHLASVARAGTARPALLVLDTDLLSTLVYGQHYYGATPAWIDAELRRRPADLYLLADTDVPWIADGAQRDRGQRRDEMQSLFRAALEKRELPFVTVRGAPDARLCAGVAAVGRARRRRGARPSTAKEDRLGSGGGG